MVSLDLVIALGVPLFLLGLGWVVGRSREQRHLSELDAREAQISHMLVTQIKSYPLAVPGHQPPCMFAGEAVIGADYFKTFLGAVRKIFGGELGAYQTMLTRARREATLRVLEQARQEGYNAVCNLRLDNADIGGNSVAAGKKKGMVMATILASGTAYHAAWPHGSSPGGR